MVGNGSSSEQLGAAPGRSAVDGVLVMSDNLPQSGGMGVGSWGGGGVIVGGGRGSFLCSLLNPTCIPPLCPAQSNGYVDSNKDGC